MQNVFSSLRTKFNADRFNKLHETMSFSQYLDMVIKRPSLAFSAYQRMYSMILAPGVIPTTKYRKTVNRYKFFDDTSIPIFGLDNTLESLVKHVRGAAHWHGPEKRILLLHGPVGSSKSTICRRIKRGMEDWSYADEGAIYTFEWVGIKEFDIKDESPCPMNDDPLKLLLPEMRGEIINAIQATLRDSLPADQRHNAYPIRITGDLNPHCGFFMGQLLKKHGDWGTVMEKHIRVKRIQLSEKDRVGIGTFQPKDPKNQDATELTGDVNYLKLGHYGVDSDPRAFSFDGEFQIANRGVLEFIEVLKLEKEFLYDLLGVCQERQIKPKKFPQIDVDMVLIGHTNSPEFQKLKADNSMEALRDRTVRVDVPYLLEWDHELNVLKQDYGPDKVQQHIAPHTLEIAALWSVLTRLKQDKDTDITAVEKAKLYNGKSLPGWNEDRVKELRDKYDRNADNAEGLTGVSARYVQNAVSNALVGNFAYINPFMVLNEISERLKIHMNANKEEIALYEQCVTLARKELEEILKDEVQKALVGNDGVIEKLFNNYIDNVTAHLNGEKIKNPYTGQDVDPDERLMRSIEEKAEVPEQQADDFRQQIAQYMFTQSQKKREVKWDSNPRLAQALRAKAFEDIKDHIKISALSSAAAATDKAMQEKIDAIRTRMCDQFGYNEQSATDVLNFVSSIFARGEVANAA